MDGYLRQSTASQARLVGPFVDDTDFKTAETGLTIANTDVKLRANGTTLSNKNSGGGTHQVNGMYSLSWDATDTANVGELRYSVVVAGALPVFGAYVVLEEAVYDALFAASAPGYVAGATVDVIKWLGTAAATPTVAGVPEVDLTHVAGATTDVSALATNVAAILVDTGTTLQGELDGIQADTEDIQARLPAALTADGVMKADTLRIGGTLQTANDVGADVNDILVDTAEIGVAGAGLTTRASAADLATVAGYLDTEIAAILADTNELQTDWANGGRLDLILDARASQASVDVIDDFLDTEIAAILVDTSTTLDDMVDDLEARLTQVLADKLAAHAASVLVMVTASGSTTTAVVFATVEGGTPSAVDDFYNGAVIVFTSGALSGQRTSITDYDGATKTATVPALTAAPAASVTAVIV